MDVIIHNLLDGCDETIKSIHMCLKGGPTMSILDQLWEIGGCDYSSFVRYSSSLIFWLRKLV